MSGRDAHALKLGETAAEIAARHGGGMQDRGQQTTTYLWDGWVLRVQFAEGIAAGLMYKKVDPLKEPDILAILAGNGGASEWQPLFVAGDEGDRTWMREDGAIAEWRAGSPYVLNLQAASTGRARELADSQPLVVHRATEAPLTATPFAEPPLVALPDEPLPALVEADEVAAVEAAPAGVQFRAEPIELAETVAMPEAIIETAASAPANVGTPADSRSWLGIVFAGTVVVCSAGFLSRRFILRPGASTVELVSNTPQGGSRRSRKDAEMAIIEVG